MSQPYGDPLDHETLRLRLLVDALDDCAILALDERGCVIGWERGPRAEPRDEVSLMGRHISTFYPEPERSTGKPERDLQTAELDGRFEEEGWRLRSDGTRFWAEVKVTPLRHGGALVGFGYVLRDSSRRHDSETRLETASAVLRATLDIIEDGILVADREGEVLFCNRAGAKNPALANDQDLKDIWSLYLADQATPCLAEATPLARARHGERVKQVELFAQTEKEDEWRWYSVNAAPLRDPRGSLFGSVGIARDMTKTKMRESELKQLSLVDELTGLCNRRAFLSLASHQLTVARRTGRPVALFFVDLDGLKEINDDLGHDHGDTALREAGMILRESFRGSDIIARLGGDEFAVLALDTDAQRCDAAVARLMGRLEELNADTGRSYHLSMSIGSCVPSPIDSDSLEALLARADGAMYEEKRRRHASRPPRAESDHLIRVDARKPA
ncbi:MAG TPA: diguanylate cyclase [Polyangiaceae bacterium]|jgi:diguanylate cyclase (GGDEF)-like protein/PAS domain S-box-containing protein|nr:diguanylate cyclase [Polyangiaceae bacterium]